MHFQADCCFYKGIMYASLLEIKRIRDVILYNSLLKARANVINIATDSITL